jgi:hypothetical protein
MQEQESRAGTHSSHEDLRVSHVDQSSFAIFEHGFSSAKLKPTSSLLLNQPWMFWR